MCLCVFVCVFFLDARVYRCVLRPVECAESVYVRERKLKAQVMYIYFFSFFFCVYFCIVKGKGSVFVSVCGFTREASVCVSGSE